MRSTLQATVALLALLVTGGVTLASPAAEERIALVIGNGAYKDSPLLNPVNDAKAVSAALRATGFVVIERHNQGAVEMRRAIREFGEKLRFGGAGLFYFAGHGVQVNGRNFLIPANADIKYEDEIEDQSVDVSLVLNKMESAKARINIVILDACRNNPFVRGSRSARSGLAAMEAPIGSLIAYATSPGQVASDGSGKNGLYTQHLVRELEEPGLKVEDVFKRVRAAVRQASNGRQVPWENTSLEGDFYFLPPKDVPTGPSPQEIRRQQEAEIQRAVAEALTRSQDEADRERKRLEAAFAERLEKERAAIRKDALERIAAAERAAQAATVQTTPASAPPQEPRESQPAPKPEAPQVVAAPAAQSPQVVAAPAAQSPQVVAAPEAQSPQVVAAPEAQSPQVVAAPEAQSPQVAAAPAGETPPDSVMVAMAAIGPDSKPKPAPDEVARGIVPPSHQVGDFWVYYRELRDGEAVTRRNYVTLKVAMARPDGYELESSDSAEPHRFDAAGNLFSKPARKGPGTMVVDPVDPLFRYPLEVGASWSARTREVQPGLVKNAEHTVSVKGWEEVQVAAGTFRALKISQVAAVAWESFPGQFVNSKRVTNVWYVPALGNHARYEILEVTRDGTVLLDQTWELDSFKVN